MSDLYSLIVMVCSLTQPFGCTEYVSFGPMPLTECEEIMRRMTLINDRPGHYKWAVCRLTHTDRK